MENKKAQNLSITTIILIILGVVVLVVLIIGFTQGWGSVKGFFTGGESELSQIATQCSVACATGDEMSWCKKNSMDLKGEMVTGTCTDFATSYDSIEECPSMPNCPQDTTAKKCTDHPDFEDLCTEQQTCSEPIQGVFSDTAGNKICCKVDCVNKPK